jgi:type II secretory pathway pseudopilin PulG
MKSTHRVVVGLSVLAIAAGVFVFSGLGNLDSGPGYKLTRAKTDLRAIQTAIDLFNARERRYPTNSEGLGTLVPTYLHAVPKDPWSRVYIYRYDGAGMPNVYSSGPNRIDEHGEGDDISVTSPKRLSRKDFR